ncbi:PREDICTED: uncharacterized protein LOC109158738 [Ipomoea nil]|uniref:uncharacterized protein LOC109158738 n=1 Tax=Ipomoea nil TaxID=35883 RepID=UPI000900F3D8|nr:PREDICTED: uncharacterized protein LOC109158738 [Ipomoea nil]
MSKCSDFGSIGKKTRRATTFMKTSKPNSKHKVVKISLQVGVALQRSTRRVENFLDASNLGSEIAFCNLNFKLSTVFEIAIVIVGDLDSNIGKRDILVEILRRLSRSDGIIGSQRDGESEITVLEHLLLKCEDDPIATIVDSTFPNFRLGIADLSYLNDSAILAPTLDVVDAVNQYMNDHNPAEGKTYLSCDSVCKSDANVDMLADLHTPEFLNALRCSGVPNHALTLKVGSPVMLLRNIDHTLGLCNGTRLIVTRFPKFVGSCSKLKATVCIK